MELTGISESEKIEHSSILSSPESSIRMYVVRSPEVEKVRKRRLGIELEKTDTTKSNVKEEKTKFLLEKQRVPTEQVWIER
jgi:hypothetical protein